MALPVFLRKSAAYVAKNSPIIMTGGAVVGLFGTVIFAVMVTPKATLVIDDLKADYEPDKVPKMEIVKKVVPLYIPSALMGGITVACIVGATKVNQRRNMALATLYSASELAMKEYQSKVMERLGEKKEREVREDVVRDRIERNPVSDNQVFITSRGDTLIYDVPSGRYFKGDIEKIRRIENVINGDLLSTFWVPLNEFYYQAEFPPIPLGDEMGWDIDHKLELRISGHLADDDQPCLAIDYQVRPRTYPF